MSHIAVFNFPAIGHVNPNLAVVEELVSRGHRVTCTVTEHFVEAVRSVGAEPLVHDSAFGEFYRSPYTADALQGEGLRCLDDALRVVAAAEEHFGADLPDLVLHDFMAWGGRFYGSKHGIEQARLFPSYGINESFSIQARFSLASFEDELVVEMVGRLAALLPDYGLDPDPMAFFQDIPELGIIFMPRAFHYDGETFDERFVFAGPCLRDRSGFQGSWEPRTSERPTLLVSLGTAATGWAEFFPMAVEALADSPYEVVLATGDHITPEELGELPAHITAQRHVPQLDVLEKATVFVTHGGMNSVMESLHHGVPMVVIPQMNEQTANGLRVEELGLGVHLGRDDVKAEVLRDAVDRVAADTDIAARVRALSEEMRAVDGPVVAADAIESHLAAG